MAKQILVIEDEPNVVAFISQGLQEPGYKVFVAYDGKQVAKKIRETTSETLPIIMLTALGTTDNTVKGLDAGADDYLAGFVCKLLEVL